MKKIKKYLIAIATVSAIMLLLMQTVFATPRIRSKSKPNLSLIPKSASSITLKWKEFGDADGYMIYRKTSKSGKWKKIKTTSIATYTNKKLKLNKKYWYKVRAYADSGSKIQYSPYSKVKSASPRLSKPTLKASGTSANKIQLTLKKPSGAKGLIIYRKTSLAGRWVKLKQTTSKTYTDKKVSANKTYYYRAKAYKKIGKTTYYSDYTSQTKAKAKLVQVTISNFTYNKNTATISHKKVYGATAYEIHYKVGLGGYQLLKTTSNLTNNIDISAINKNVLKFKIRTLQKIGKKTYYGDFSAEKQVPAYREPYNPPTNTGSLPQNPVPSTPQNPGANTPQNPVPSTPQNPNDTTVSNPVNTPTDIPDGKPITANTNLTVTKGASISQGINLNGRKITMAITEEGQYNTASFKRTIAAFETEYNCKVELKTLKFFAYNQEVARAKAAGNIYDICYIHGSMFPSCAIDGLYEPLNNTLRSGDIATTTLSGGIDLNKTSNFVFKDKIYGTCNFNAANPYVIYYNKKMMADAGYSGAKDPRKMAENGKWSWNVIRLMGRKVTDVGSNIYFLSNSFSAGRAVQLCYGAPVVIADGRGGYKQNVTSEGYINANKFIQQLCIGSNAITEPVDTTHPYNSSETFMKGISYMWTEESVKYFDIAKEVKSSTAFYRDKNNIGIVEMPLGGYNEKYPTGWLTAVACGKGKDPRVSIAWDVFRSKYVDPVQDSNAMSAADKEYTNNLITGNIVFEPASFFSADNSTADISNNITTNIRNGADVAKTVADYKDAITACIEYTLKIE